jgi:hypothetical protein
VSLNHSAEVHLVSPPPPAALPAGWVLGPGGAGKHGGTFTVVEASLAAAVAGVVELGAAGLPVADSAAAMAAALVVEGVVHVRGALPPAEVRLCGPRAT